ncbi:MAG: transcriptional repressor LexA [Planctomycetales bacterium]|nr:transcriptional repressor LexA [bacterium]UNM09329.1 MAG: transcriptional repressor LexA [Planctomycetales bacterium]
MAKRVTDKQREVLQYIADFIEGNGYAPSIRDIAGKFDCSVKGAYDHVVALEKKGLIERARNRSRSILLGQRGKQVLGVEEAARIPILGRIAAGVMTYADHNVEDYVNMPMDNMQHEGGNLFALRVKGDSMINAGIKEGDIAIFREQQTASTGDIVAAMVEDEATVKFFFRQAGRVVLKAANPLYPDMYFNEIRVLGKLKSLIRQYD